jgi:hypothetical protein
MIPHPALPMTVVFRPDRDPTRTEMVFELGRLWSGPPRHLGPYTAEILHGGQGPRETRCAPAFLVLAMALAVGPEADRQYAADIDRSRSSTAICLSRRRREIFR